MNKSSERELLSRKGGRLMMASTLVVKGGRGFCRTSAARFAYGES